MRPEVLRRVESYLGFVYEKLKDNNDRITICAVGASQYLNYLIEKGIILSSEKLSYSQFALDFIEKELNIEIYDFIKDGLVELMQEVKHYDYETIGYFVKKVNDLNR